MNFRVEGKGRYRGKHRVTNRDRERGSVKGRVPLARLRIGASFMILTVQARVSDRCMAPLQGRISEIHEVGLWLGLGLGLWLGLWLWLGLGLAN